MDTDLSFSGSGIIEIDEVLFGEVFATVGKFVLHQTEVVTHVQQQPTETPDNLLQKLDDVSELDARKWSHVHNLVLIYKGDFDLEFAYTIVTGKFAKYLSVFCVGLTTSGVVAYVHKKDFKCLPVDLSINDRDGVAKNPKLYRFKKNSRN